MGCIFSAKGRDFDADRFLKRAVFRPRQAWQIVTKREAFQLAMTQSKRKTMQVWRRGQPYWSHKPRGERHKHSGFLLDVSKAGLGNLPQQIRDAIRFLKANERALKSLHGFPGVESLNLGFAINRTLGAVVQWETFPSELLRFAGELGIDLTIGFYAPCEPKRRKTKSNEKANRGRS